MGVCKGLFLPFLSLSFTLFLFGFSTVDSSITLERRRVAVLHVCLQLTRQLFVIRIDLIFACQKDSFVCIFGTCASSPKECVCMNEKKFVAYVLYNLRACINFYCCLHLLLLLCVFFYILGGALHDYFRFLRQLRYVTHVGYKFAFSSVKHAIKTRQY